MTSFPESQLRTYLRVLRTYSRSILAITVVVMVAAGVVSFSLAPKYVSEAKILVKPISLVSNQNGNVTAPNMDTEQQVAQSLAVAQLAAISLNLSLEPDQLQQTLLKNLKVTSSANTEILGLAYTARTPSLAQRRAGAFADAYLQFRRDQVLNDLTSSQTSIQERIDTLRAQLAQVNRDVDRANPENAGTLRAQANQLIEEIGFLQGNLGSLLTPEQLAVGAIVEPAILPLHPVSGHVRDIVLALVVGLALGIGIAFLRDHLDDRLRNRSEVEGAIHAPVLGVLPFSPVRAAFGSSIAVSREHGPIPDAFRALRTGFLFAAARADAKTFIVTSAFAEDGKTTTVANLGVSLAQAGKKVILISGDLRRPRLHKLFGCENNFGLTNVLAGERTPVEGLIKLPDVFLLPSGPSPANVIDLLDSDAMKRLLATFRATVDFVLIDTGPVLGAADAMALAPLVDAVLVVANAQQTTRSAAQRARKQLELVNARVMGTALYDPADRAEESYYEYYMSFSSGGPAGNGNSHRIPAPAPRVEPQQPQWQPGTRPQPPRHETLRPAPTTELHQRTPVEQPREGV